MFFRRKYYDAEPIYVREQTPNWYQQLPTTNEVMQRTLQDFVPGKKVLQVGCGGAWLGRFLIQNGAVRYAGFDFSETAILYAKKRLAKFRNAEVYVADALEENAFREQYDLIVAHQFAQCLIGEDRIIWLQHARSSLHPERGILVMSTVVGVPDGVRAVVNPETRISRFRNRYFAEDAEIRFELESANFAIERVFQSEANMNIYIARPKIHR